MTTEIRIDGQQCAVLTDNGRAKLVAALLPGATLHDGPELDTIEALVVVDDDDNAYDHQDQYRVMGDGSTFVLLKHIHTGFVLWLPVEGLRREY